MAIMHTFALYVINFTTIQCKKRATPGPNCFSNYLMLNKKILRISREKALSRAQHARFGTSDRYRWHWLA